VGKQRREKKDLLTRPKFCGGLGFRDIELFNLALLARQAWRILQVQVPDSLSARALSAVYYPHGDFLGARPSRIWRAIMEGKEVVSQGIIRRIGTGDSTEIWSMNWLTRDGFLRLVPTDKDDPPIM
jgi:hypothetical protein